MNYQETLDYINSINWKGSVLGLDRIRELLEKLGNPQNDLRFIHIAGTNGKGSTAAFLSSILVKAGYRTGLFTSPYIEVFNERMQINNTNISDEELAEITTYIRPFADSMEDRPTEFELNTAISLEYFKRNACDVVVFEVGMGGELDSTNIITSTDVAVITAIGLDHTEMLGDTVEKIAATKAGIIKPGCSVVLYRQKDSIEEVIRNRCQSLKVPFYVSQPELIKPTGQDIFGQTFEVEGISGELSICLAGTYQLENIAVVLKTVEALKEKGYVISEANVKEGLSSCRWPGRFEILRRNPVFLVDGAHNPHGIRATAQSLKAVFKDKKLIFIFGVMADKEYDKMLNEILPMGEELFAVTPDNPRALEAEELARIVNEKGVHATACHSIEEAVDSAFKRADKDGTICALGSLYMIGDIKKYIHDNY